jgi:hypothetical protein
VHQRAFAWGECKDLAGKGQLATSLRSQGLDIDDRRFSIAVRDCECFTIQFDGRDESLASIEGSAASLSALARDVQRVSIALTAVGVTFWIEITDSAQNRIEYFHNQNPE